MGNSLAIAFRFAALRTLCAEWYSRNAPCPSPASPRPGRNSPRERYHTCMKTLALSAALLLVAFVDHCGTASAQNPAAPAATQPAASSPPAPVPFQPIAHVEKRGDGPVAMVLIPGLSCDWTVFDAFMKRHEHDYTMY